MYNKFNTKLKKKIGEIEMTKTQEKAKRTTVTLADNLRNELEEVSQKLNISKSTIMNILITKYLKKEFKK